MPLGRFKRSLWLTQASFGMRQFTKLGGGVGGDWWWLQPASVGTHHTLCSALWKYQTNINTNYLQTPPFGPSGES